MIKLLLSVTILLSTTGTIQNEQLKETKDVTTVAEDPGGGTGHLITSDKSLVAYDGGFGIASVVDPGGGTGH